MGQVPRLRNLRENEPQSEVNRALADFCRDVSRVLDGSKEGGVSIENMGAKYVQVDIEGDDVDVELPETFRTPPRDVSVCQVLNLSSPDVPGSLSSVPWTYRSGRVRITNFPGLGASVRYRVRLLVMG